MARHSEGARIYLRGNVWWVGWSDGKNGKIRQALTSENGEPLHKKSPNQEVQAAAARIHNAWFREKSEAASGKKMDATVCELTQKFVKAHVDGWSRKTMTAYRRYMDVIESHFGDETAIRSISKEAAENFKLDVKARGGRKGGPLSTRSTNNLLEFTQTVFEYAFGLEWVERNVFAFVKPLTNVPVREKDPFTVQETAKILNTAKTNPEFYWFYPVVLAVAITTTRRGPLPQMLVRDYDIKLGELDLRGKIAKQGRAYKYAVGRVLAMELEKISKGRSADEPLFIDPSGKGLNAKAFDPPDPKRNKPEIPKSRVWYRLLAAAEVRPRGIHNLRSAGVTNLANANVTMDKITAVTGQTEDVAREFYLKINRESQRATMEKLEEMYDQSPAEEPAQGCNVNRQKITLELEPDEAQSLAMFLQIICSPNPVSGTIQAQSKEEEGGKPSKSKAPRKMAERQGFEPWLPGYPVKTLSRRSPSTTRPPLRLRASDKEPLRVCG